MEALNQTPLKSTSTQIETARLNLIGQPNLQSNILASAVTENLQLPCDISNALHYRNTLSKISGHGLVLIDCYSVSADVTADILDASQGQDIDIALINAQPHGPHEQLAEWPQLKGIFYANTSQPHLLQGLRELLNDGHWLPRKVMESLLARYRRAPKRSTLLDKLTRREREILQQLLEGATNQDIAATLYVSEHTVKSHLYNVFKKIGVSNRLQACNWAKQYL